MHRLRTVEQEGTAKNMGRADLTKNFVSREDSSDADVLQDS